VYAAGYVAMIVAMGQMHEDERTWLWSWAGRPRVLLRGVS